MSKQKTITLTDSVIEKIECTKVDKEYFTGYYIDIFFKDSQVKKNNICISQLKKFISVYDRWTRYAEPDSEFNEYDYDESEIGMLWKFIEMKIIMDGYVNNYHIKNIEFKGESYNEDYYRNWL